MLRWNPTRTAWKAPALALALLAGPAAVPALAGPAPGQVVPPPTLRSVLLDWSFDPLVAVPLLAVAVLYLRGRQRVVLRGLGMIALALQSPIERYDTALFSVHASQHLLLAMLAAPLLAMGAPITMLLMTTSPPVRKRIVRVVHSLPVRVIGYPLIAWVLFTMTLYALYFSPLFELSLRNQYVHDAIHLHFIAVGLLFWWPVVGVDPTRWRLHHLARV